MIRNILTACAIAAGLVALALSYFDVLFRG